MGTLQFLIKATYPEVTSIEEQLNIGPLEYLDVEPKFVNGLCCAQGRKVKHPCRR